MGTFTKYEGLWKSNRRSNLYVSKQFSKEQLKEIPENFRLMIEYNNQYEKDGDYPRFNFTFADDEHLEEVEFVVEVDESIDELFKRIDFLLNDIKNCTNHCGRYDCDIRENIHEIKEILEEIDGSIYYAQY